MSRPESSTLEKRAARTYIFRVTLAGKPADIPGVDGMKDGLWVLPRNPTGVGYQGNARTMTFATGTTTARADQQGVDPPTITIQGTFGEAGAWKPGLKGGLDGRRSQRALENLIRGFLKLTAEEGREGRGTHALEWHDTYRDEHWLVAPALVPYGQEDSSRPYMESYNVRLTGLDRVDAKVPEGSSLNRAMLDRHGACPLNPRCRYGGPFVKGCPYRSAK